VRNTNTTGNVILTAVDGNARVYLDRKGTLKPVDGSEVEHAARFDSYEEAGKVMRRKRRTASWVIVRLSDGAAMFETFDQILAQSGSSPAPELKATWAANPKADGKDHGKAVVRDLTLNRPIALGLNY